MHKERNIYVSSIKLISASFVVFGHVHFQGNLGRAMDCLARFTVPLFFVISGYYSYQKDAATIKRRLRKITLLALFSNALYLLYNLFPKVLFHREEIEEYIRNILDVKTIALFLFTGKNPFSFHLWYLSAMILVYITFLLVAKFFGGSGKDVRYREIYIIAACAFMFQIVFGVKAQSVGMKIDYIVYRYFLFYGFPCFTYGLFLHEYGERIVDRYSFTCGKACIMITAGIALSLIQWFGIGKVEVPLGMLLVVTSLALLAFVKPGPRYSRNRVFIGMEIVSTVVFIIHPLVNSIISVLINKAGLLAWRESNESLFPLIVLGVSIIIGVVASASLTVLRKCVNRY